MSDEEKGRNKEEEKKERKKKRRRQEDDEGAGQGATQWVGIDDVISDLRIGGRQ